MKNKNKQYCSNCVLNSDVPGVTINENGVCNICQMDYIADSKLKYKKMMRKTLEFSEYIKSNKDMYDCMLMLSGGKDSLYVLSKLCEENDIRFLAYTLKHPYLTDDALCNLESVLKKYDFDHVYIRCKDEIYQMMYQTIFRMKTRYNLFDSHRMACHVCVCFTIVSSYIYAVKMGIRYIIICTDPEQIGTMQMDIRHFIEIFEEIYGQKCLHDTFGRANIETILNADKNSLPQFISPYASLIPYNKEIIVQELKDKGIYQGNTSLHKCKLSPVLYAYSLKKYKVYYGIIRLSNDVRQKKIKRETAISFLERYMNFMESVNLKKELMEDEKRILKEIISSLYPPEEMPELFDFEFTNTLDIHHTAQMYNIDI